MMLGGKTEIETQWLVEIGEAEGLPHSLGIVHFIAEILEGLQDTHFHRATSP